MKSRKPSDTIRKRIATVRFGQAATIAIVKVVAQTGWSANLATNRLIELGCSYYDREGARCDALEEQIQLAQAKAAILREADARIAALKNRKS
jgi:hypothetical protein